MKKIVLAGFFFFSIGLQSAAFIDRSQSALLPKIKRYLETYSPHLEFPKTVFGGGCNGLSTLWAYAKRLEDEQDNLPNPKADDIYFFEQMYEWLLAWDGRSPLSADKKASLDRFLQNILLLQDRKIARALLGNNLNDGSTTLALYLEDSKRGKLCLDYCCVLVPDLHPTDSDSILEKILEPKKIVRIVIRTKGHAGVESAHALSVYCNSHSHDYFCFDSNSSSGKGEVKKDTKKVLAWLVEKFKYYKSQEQQSFEFFRFDFESEKPFVVPHPIKDLKLTASELNATSIRYGRSEQLSPFLNPTTVLNLNAVVVQWSFGNDIRVVKKLYGLHFIDALQKDDVAWMQKLIACGASLNESTVVDGQEETALTVVLAKLCKNKIPALEVELLKVFDLLVKDKAAYTPRERKLMQELLGDALSKRRAMLVPLLCHYYFQKVCEKNPGMISELQRFFEHWIINPNHLAPLQMLLPNLAKDSEDLASCYELLAHDCLAVSHFLIAELLIEKGASIDKRQKKRTSCLGVAIKQLVKETFSGEEKGRYLVFVEKLLERGGRLNLDEKPVISELFIEALKGGQREYIPLLARYYHQSAYLKKDGRTDLKDTQVMVERYFELLFDCYSSLETAASEKVWAPLASHLSDAKGFPVLEDFYGRQCAEAVDLGLYALAQLLLHKSASLYATLGCTPQDIFCKAFTKIVEAPKGTPVSQDLLALAEELVRGQNSFIKKERELVQAVLAKALSEGRDELIPLLTIYYEQLLHPGADVKDKLNAFMAQEIKNVMNEFVATGTVRPDSLSYDRKNKGRDLFYGAFLYDLVCVKLHPIAHVLIEQRVNPHLALPQLRDSTDPRTAFHLLITKLLPPCIHTQTSEDTENYFNLFKKILMSQSYYDSSCYSLVRQTFKEALQNHYAPLAEVIATNYSAVLDETRGKKEKSLYDLAREYKEFHPRIVTLLLARGADKVQRIVPVTVANPPLVAPSPVVENSGDNKTLIALPRPFIAPTALLLAGIASGESILLNAGLGLGVSALTGSLQKKGSLSPKVATLVGVGAGTLFLSQVAGDLLCKALGGNQFIEKASLGSLSAYLGASIGSGLYLAKKSYDYGNNK